MPKKRKRRQLPTPQAPEPQKTPEDERVIRIRPGAGRRGRSPVDLALSPVDLAAFMAPPAPSPLGSPFQPPSLDPPDFSWLIAVGRGADQPTGAAAPKQPPPQPAVRPDGPSTTPPPEWYIDLDGIGAMVNRTKRAMEHYKTRKADPLPSPDIPGGGGRKDEWKWSTVRPWLERTFKRDLFWVNPDNRPRAGV